MTQEMGIDIDNLVPPSCAADREALTTLLKEAERREIELKEIYNARRELVINLRNTLTAVHQHPPEILSEIFCAYAELNRDTPLAQLILTHVCHSWRQVAHHSTPRLWTSLYLSLHSDTPFSDHGSMITQWLNRSSLPVDIRIDTEYAATSDLYSLRTEPVGKWIPQEVMEVLVPFCSRIQTLALRAPLEELTTLISLPSNSFPILQELDFDIGISNDQWNKDHKIVAFEGSSLRNVNWRCSSYPFTWSNGLDPVGPGGLRTLSFDTAQLTSLYLGDNYNMNPEHCWNLLNQFQNLTQCTLRLQVIPFGTGYDGILPITLPHLTKLTLECPYEELLTHTNAFTLLTAPVLADLCLDFSESSKYRRVTLSSALIDFVRRCRCPLDHLSFIRADALTNKDLTCIIDALSSLRSLTVVGKKIPPKNLFQKLACKKNKSPSLPHLELLRFGIYTNADSNGLSPKMLFDVVESRNVAEQMDQFNVYARLTKVQIDVVVETKAAQPSAQLQSSDEELQPEPLDMNRWLDKLKPAETERLQRLRSLGISIREDVLPFNSKGSGIWDHIL